MSRRLPQTVRKRVQTRAHHRCEYCQLPEKHSHYPHQVDHIIPPLHGGTDDDDNLAWACFQCNSAKTSNIASYDFETNQLTRLFHPRQDAWQTHFRYESGQLMGITPVGRVTVRVLQINLPELVLMRQLWMGLNDW